MEISLPDEQGRHQILNIHTTRMKESKIISEDVNMEVSTIYLNSKCNTYVFMFRNLHRKLRTSVVLN